MKLLFDECVPVDLMNGFEPHDRTHIKGTEFEGLENGELLSQAQLEFDVLITADANIYHQQKVARYDIAVVVLRAFRNSHEELQRTVGAALKSIDTIQPGEVDYVYADDRLRERDRRKKKGPYRQA
jgi:predicted nuclease of predicted toxin-antitoxin system